MNSNARKLAALAIISGACMNGVLNSIAAGTTEDPAWKPGYTEVGLIQVGDAKPAGALRNFCLNAEGNILACYAPVEGPKSSAAKNPTGLRLLSPKGELLKTFPLEIKPTAVCVAKDGSI